eukprot:scaffold77058_cov67-Phaeocystis_antarctica.AAC.1
MQDRIGGAQRQDRLAQCRSGIARGTGTDKGRRYKDSRVVLRSWGLSLRHNYTCTYRLAAQVSLGAHPSQAPAKSLSPN